MAMIPVMLATEDELSEALAVRLLAELNGAIAEPTKLRKNGFGYLKSKMSNWREVARLQMMFVLTDLDQAECVVAFRQEWLGQQPVPAKLVFRVAVREVESWVLADHEALRKLLGSKIQCPAAPDTLPDPKQYLLKQAQKAPRKVRDELVAQKGAMASQGLGYNRCLVDWVNNEWSPERAASLSPSLLRARSALKDAVLQWTS